MRALCGALELHVYLCNLIPGRRSQRHDHGVAAAASLRRKHRRVSLLQTQYSRVYGSHDVLVSEAHGTSLLQWSRPDSDHHADHGSVFNATVPHTVHIIHQCLATKDELLLLSRHTPYSFNAALEIQHGRSRTNRNGFGVTRQVLDRHLEGRRCLAITVVVTGARTCFRDHG
jgi:hypothetical protein